MRSDSSERDKARHQASCALFLCENPWLQRQVDRSRCTDRIADLNAIRPQIRRVVCAVIKLASSRRLIGIGGRSLTRSLQVCLSRRYVADIAASQ